MTGLISLASMWTEEFVRVVCDSGRELRLVGVQGVSEIRVYVDSCTDYLLLFVKRILILL